MCFEVEKKVIPEMDNPITKSSQSSDGNEEPDPGSCSGSASAETEAASGSAAESSFSLLDNAVNKSLKRITFKQRILPYVKEHFREVYKADSGKVLDIFKLMMNQLENMIKEDIQLQLKESHVEEHLNRLDKIKQESGISQKKWRPSGCATQDIKAHVQESLTKQHRQLTALLKNLESENHELQECVNQSSDELMESVRKVEELSSSWQEAALFISDATRAEFVNYGN